MKARAHVVISGSVTGVFFRSFVRNQARVRGITGWVRNTAAGQIEAVFEGDRDLITALIEECRRGLPTASVGDVTVEWGEPEEAFAGFEIR